MTMEVELDIDDYNNALGWFIKAFGQKNDSSDCDKKTYQKLSVMAQAHLDLIEWLEKYGDED